MDQITITTPTLEEDGPITTVHVTVSYEIFEGYTRVGRYRAPGPLKIRAQIDTGAEMTVISPSVIENLHISPRTYVGVITATEISPDSPVEDADVYEVCIVFPNNAVKEIKVIALPLYKQSIQGLIGRDILKETAFFFNGKQNSFTLIF